MAAPPPPPPLPGTKPMSMGGPPAPPSLNSPDAMNRSSMNVPGIPAGKRAPPGPPSMRSSIAVDPALTTTPDQVTTLGSPSSSSASGPRPPPPLPPRADSTNSPSMMGDKGSPGLSQSRLVSEGSPSSQDSRRPTFPTHSPSLVSDLDLQRGSLNRPHPPPLSVSAARPAKPSRKPAVQESSHASTKMNPVLTSMLPGGVGGMLPPAPADDSEDEEPDTPITPAPSQPVRDRPSSTTAAGLSEATFAAERGSMAVEPMQKFPPPVPLQRGSSSPHLGGGGAMREVGSFTPPPLQHSNSDLSRSKNPGIMHVYQDPNPAVQPAISPRIAKKPKLVKQLSEFNDDFSSMFGSDPGPEALMEGSIPKGREVGKSTGPPSVRAARGGAESQFGTPLSYIHPHQAFVSHPNYTLSLELIVAVVDGKSSAISKHAKLGADVNITDESGRSLLHLAVYHGHENVVKKLAKAGAWMNATDKYGRSPLIVSLYRGSTSMFKTLLRLGGDVSQADLDGWTPLHWAVDKGLKDAAKMVLRESAYVDPQDVTGKTPLVYAVERNNAALVKLLLSYSATTLLPDNERRTAVSIAANRGYESILAMCLERFYNERTGEGVTPNKAPPGSATPRDVAPQVPSVDQAQPVYASSPRAGKGGATSEDMEAALAAAAAATEATLDAMKQKGVAKVSSKQWAMTTKLKSMKSECYRSDSGCQTLGAAAQRGHTGCCAVFFSIGVEVDDRDELERTPLMMAATFNQTETALKLLEHRANARIPDSRLETPLHWAALHGNMKLAGELIKRAADINAANATGTTPLHLAAKHGKLDIVNLLLTQSADFRATTSAGQTALELAKDGQHTIVAEVLQQAEATGPVGSLSRVSSRVSLNGRPSKPGHAPPRRGPGV